MNSIGFKIKKLREKKSISQEDLAFRLDITQSNLSKIENGQIDKIDFILMQKVCDFFNVAPDYFLDEKILQENRDKAIGNIYSTVTIHQNISDNLLESLLQNQKQITELIAKQNYLFEQFIKKS